MCGPICGCLHIATVLYLVPARYNWLFQFYLRAEGLALSWVGSGRLIFSHDYIDHDFEAVSERFLAAARTMQKRWQHPDGQQHGRNVFRTVVQTPGDRKTSATPAASYARIVTLQSPFLHAPVTGSSHDLTTGLGPGTRRRQVRHCRDLGQKEEVA